MAILTVKERIEEQAGRVTTTISRLGYMVSIVREGPTFDRMIECTNAADNQLTILRSELRELRRLIRHGKKGGA